jgi:SAM-dependent methyltransferase
MIDPIGSSQNHALPNHLPARNLRVQAAVDAHEFVIAFARRSIQPGARVLDIATGEGALAEQLSTAGFDVSVTSWDGKFQGQLSAYRIDLDLPFSLADVGGERFDLVICCEIIEHVENPSRFLRDVHGLMKDDGRVIVSTPNVESAEARLQWLVKGRPAMFSGQEISKNRHISLMWKEGLEHLFRLAGFAILDQRFLGPMAVGRPPMSWLKRVVYLLMRAILSGDLDGGTRLYILKTAGMLPRKQGPGDVY